MRIVNLIENTEGINACLFEHGLSFYIETKKHKLLVDTGQSDAFIANALKLGINLAEVDIVVLSHGHYDHSGGIMEFAKINSKARILMQKSATDEYYHKNKLIEKYIGVDENIKTLPGVELLEGDLHLDDELFLYSGVTGRRLWPKGNLELMVKKDGAFILDEFKHEQYLVITDDHKKVLISGCAHNGVLNILERYRSIYGNNPDVMISGFHMMKKNGEYTQDEIDVIEETAKELSKIHTKFYTGHCTGELPYQIMKEYMGEQLVYVHSGDEVVVDK